MESIRVWIIEFNDSKRGWVPCVWGLYAQRKTADIALRRTRADAPSTGCSASDFRIRKYVPEGES